jgi:hypothetical protein
MALEFPKEWRFDENLGRMPQEALPDLVSLIEKVAAQSRSPKAVYETFKGRFGVSSTSSSESWAHSDMVDAMTGAEMNTPEFIEAYWAGMTDVSDEVAIPPPDRVNAILRKHGVGYALYPPRLVQEVGPSIVITPDAPVAANMPGYTIGQRLGGGAFGEVFQASRRNPFCEFEFAVKFHRPSVFADAERARGRFEREVVALGKLQHRAIVSYADAGIDARGHPFLVMSLVKGQNLRDATAGQHVRVIVGHMIEVLGAISHAHDNNILHRDLKPPNILVRQADSQPVIVDFGLAYLIDEMSQAELTFSGIGTAPYVPHESLVNPRMRSPAHDIYSCGVILYELLVRRVPDLGNYVDLGRIDPDWGPLDPVLRNALARHDSRFRSAAEFRAALVAAVTALPALR